MISVVIPSFNNTHTLPTCLDSIARQTYRDLEIIIIDDASTDNTAEVVERVSERGMPVMSIRHETNRGANAARNTGWKIAKGEHLFFCDADIVLRSNALQTLADALKQNSNASYAYSSFRFGWKRFSSFPFDANRLRKMPYIHTTSLIRREHFPGFDETIKRFQDWDLYLTMLEQGYTGVWVPEILFTVTNTKGTMSRWLPSFVYRIPWFPSVKRYRAAVAIISQKHDLDLL